jgi:hypothetical protein
MAGTRRRSRAGDTANTFQRQPSASHTTAVIEEDRPIPEVPSVIEDDSPHPDTPKSQSTKGFCRNCGTNIGEFFNAWHKVTGSYYMPALLGSYRSLLKSSGKQKAASRGTAIEGWCVSPISIPRMKSFFFFASVAQPYHPSQAKPNNTLALRLNPTANHGNYWGSLGLGALVDPNNLPHYMLSSIKTLTSAMPLTL